MIKVTKARRNANIIYLLLLPLFLGYAAWEGISGHWQISIAILGVWVFLFLFATSYLFQAVIILISAFYSFFNGYWLAWAICLLLTGYVYYANRITDENMQSLPGQIGAASPFVGTLFRFIHNTRNQLILIFIILLASAIFTGVLLLVIEIRSAP